MFDILRQIKKKLGREGFEENISDEEEGRMAKCHHLRRISGIKLGRATSRFRQVG